MAWLGAQVSTFKMAGKLVQAVSWKFRWRYESGPQFQATGISQYPCLVMLIARWLGSRSELTRKREKYVEFLWHILRTHMALLHPYAIAQGSHKGLPISRGKLRVLSTLWEKYEGHIDRRACEMGDIAVAMCGKYSLLHHLFSFGTGKQLEFQHCKFEHCWPFLHSITNFFSHLCWAQNEVLEVLR